jgi:hypothetical protein
LRLRHVTKFEDVFVALGNDPAGFHKISNKINYLCNI